MTRAKPGGTMNSADMVGVIGSPGTGKSSYVKKDLLKKFSRLLVWSPLEETDDYASFCGGVVVHGKITELVAAVKRGDKAIVFVPIGKKADVDAQFEFFCRIAWELINSTVLVEELSHVTTPGHAPPAWKKLSTGGRHRGLRVIGISQRPAHIDKDFLGGCTEVRCYRVNYDRDAKVMADSLDLGAEGAKTIRKLPNFHYFHKKPDLSVTQGINKAL